MSLTNEQVIWLECVETELQAPVAIPNHVVLPGDSLDGATLSLARTVIRRAEHLAALLWHQGRSTHGEVLRFVNRLSDLVLIKEAG